MLRLLVLVAFGLSLNACGALPTTDAYPPTHCQKMGSRMPQC